MPKVVIYVRQADAVSLEAEGHKVEDWVRGLIARAFEKRNEKQEKWGPDHPSYDEMGQ